MPLPLFAVALAQDRIARQALVDATLLARIYDPHGAAEVGWLDRVVDADAVEAEAIAEARRLAVYSGAAYAQTKQVLRSPTVNRVRDRGDADLARFSVEPAG
jgi:enoyl-CoA hydratase